MKRKSPSDQSVIILACVASIVFWYFTEWEHEIKFMNEDGRVATITTPLLEQIGGSLLVGLVYGSVVACVWGRIIQMWKHVSQIVVSRRPKALVSRSAMK